MTNSNRVLMPDEPPKSGKWVETCDVLPEISAEEMEQGETFGEELPDDDEEGPDLDDLRALTSAPLTERERALAKAKALKRVMLTHGVPEVRIHLNPGRPNSFGVFDALFVVDEMSHHTVSRLGPNKTPVLALCINGRSDLPGPLCNGYGGYDLCYRIITFGYANHPGEGGPLTVPAFSGGTFTIPRDSARRYAWGTEWEGGLAASDWDKVLTNPRNGKQMTMREFMGRSNAALREYHKIVHHSEHSTWTSRKIDRLGYSALSGTKELERFIGEDDDMPDKETLQDWVRTTPITTEVGDADKPTPRPLQQVLADLERTQEKLSDQISNGNAMLREIKRLLGKDAPPQ
jgi:hypothetical protein